MKILVIQDRLRSGGTERQSLFLSEAFASAGNEVTLMTFRPGGVLGGPPAGPLVRRTPGGPARIALQPFDTGLDWFAPGLVRRAARLAPDVILCHGRMANCRAGGIQRSLPSAAVVATMRTGKPLPWMFRRSVRTARHVIANCRQARDFLVTGLGVSTDKVSVIHNPLLFGTGAAFGAGGRPTRTPRAEELRGASGASPGTIVLLCVAMFRPEKNQRELIEIASGLPPGLDWQLWLAGDGPTRNACIRLARERGSGGRVKFPGFASDPGGLYEAADVAVHASASESLSNFLIESQAAGLPAVAYAAQGVAECMVPDRTGWVTGRGDRAAFRLALGRLAAEPPEVRAARSLEAAAFARATFDPTRQVAAYLDLFQRLLKS
ncbi:MAG: glycosyltransferase [Opitutaceae bacterium]|jgi:glycosyltransferase involved in cell wall biosynthesis